MLSRTADNLYWMARYMERAENTARFVSGIYQMSLLPVGGANVRSQWEVLFQTEAEKQEFIERYDGYTPDAVIAYMALDAKNPSSIRSCIRKARMNVRATRHVLTTELWNSINGTWFDIKGMDYAQLDDMGCQEFFDWIKERAHLFRGVVYGTMRRGEAFMFWQLGSFIERAENTARLLAVRFRAYADQRHVAGGARDYYEWGKLLRSVNAFKSYREIYGSDIVARQVAELLVLRPDIPRSLSTCVDEIRPILAQLRPDSPCARLAEELHAHLAGTRMDRVFRSGFTDFVDDFMVRANQLGLQVQKDFLMIR